METAKSFPGRVVFDHLPKTAGQAVNAWLRQELGRRSVTDNLIGGHDLLIQQFGGKYSVISAHVEFSGEGFDPRYDYVTLFRNPVDRVISWIFFLLENHGDQEVVELRSGVRQFLNSEGEEGGNWIFANAITNHLCSIDGVFPVNSDTRLNHALSVVDRYAVWGLYERMPEFLADFAGLLEVPAPAHLAVVTVAWTATGEE